MDLERKQEKSNDLEVLTEQLFSEQLAEQPDVRNSRALEICCRIEVSISTLVEIYWQTCFGKRSLWTTVKYKQLYQKQQQGLSLPVQMLASLFLFHTLLNLIFFSVGIWECALLPWLLKVEKRHIKTVIESTSGKLSNVADKTEGKIILHIKHPLNDKQSRGLGMLFASCI